MVVWNYWRGDCCLFVCAGMAQEIDMCRNIKKLRYPDRPPTDQELEEAALQFVRKVSGYRKPSKKNEAAFETAVTDIASITRQLFDSLNVKK